MEVASLPLNSDPTVAAFFERLAASRKSALLLDYDGTLAPFRVERQKALPYEGVNTALQEIIDTGRTRIVIITGREAHDIQSLLEIDPFPEVWGSHGLQRLRPGGSCEMPVLDPRALEAIADAERWLAYQGLQNLAEPKPGSIAAHWRAVNHQEAAQLRGRILLGWFPIAQSASLALLEFDGGVELRVPDRDKGYAIRTILEEIGLQSPVAFLGDDRSDEFAFQALRGRGLTALVRPKVRNTSAQIWIKPPEELLEFLRLWRDACKTTSLASTATYSG